MKEQLKYVLLSSCDTDEYLLLYVFTCIINLLYILWDPDIDYIYSGAYLYRKERKKSRKISERASASEDGSLGSPTRLDTDDVHGVTSSSEDDSSMEEEAIHIELSNDMRGLLETDYFLIKDKNKVSCSRYCFMSI